MTADRISFIDIGNIYCDYLCVELQQPTRYLRMKSSDELNRRAIAEIFITKKQTPHQGLVVAE